MNVLHVHTCIVKNNCQSCAIGIYSIN